METRVSHPVLALPLSFGQQAASVEQSPPLPEGRSGMAKELSLPPLDVPASRLGLDDDALVGSFTTSWYLPGSAWAM